MRVSRANWKSALVGMTCAALASTTTFAAEWKPQEPVEIIVGVGAGGAHDRTARLIQGMWDRTKALNVPVTIVNKPGGGGALAMAQLGQQAGNPHRLAIIGPTLLTNRIVGVTPVTYADFSPIAILYSEAIAFAVRADSDIKDGKDLVRRLVTDPQALTIGIATARGNTNHIAMGSVTKAAGGDPRKLKVVIFDSGGKVATALLGGHVAVVASNASNLARLGKGGKLRLLAVTSPERVHGLLADVPTWKELGVNSVVENFRGVMAPKGLTEAQLTYWESAFANLSQRDEWKEEVKNQLAFGKFRNRAQSASYLKEKYEELQSVLQALDLAK